MSKVAGAEQKELGNQYFTEQKYDLAISSYTDAIVPTYFVNRALCYLRLSNWASVVDDCKQAIQLDPTSIKAHFFMGQALAEIGNYDEALVVQHKAFDLAQEQKINFGDDITHVIRQTKQKRWKIKEDERLKERNEFHQFLLQLLTDHKDRQLSSPDSDVHNEEREKPIILEHEERVKQLDALFEAVDEKRKRREVPDYLCGQISYELMTDPVITPSGITYDRKDIEQHLKRVGHFDPVTRQELTEDQLIPNLAMKEVVSAFVAENDWVEHY
ncbi:hypothetical protein EMCRGX_G021461 [Ephydatia muelleri]